MERDLFDIKWLTNGLRVSVKGLSAGTRVTLVFLATHSLGSKWWIDETMLKTLKPDIVLQKSMTCLEDL